jgi:hypothetical protein
MDIFSKLDQISDRESSPKKVISAGKKPLIEQNVITLSDAVPDYKQRTKSFIKRYEKFLGKSFDYKIDSFKALAQWLVEHVAPSVSQRSWRAYRLCVASSTGHPAIKDILAQGSGYSKSSQLSNFKRQKHLKESDLSRLIMTLNDSRSVYKEALIDWLKSTILTGLRPIEWGEAYIVYPDGLNIALKVRTRVKHPGNTQTKCPEYRYIPLNHLAPDDIECLNSHIARFTESLSSEKPSLLYDNCRKLLNFTCRLTFQRAKKTSINLYSARHQFCANLKAGEFDKELICLLMGQSSFDIQKNHYARKSVGSPSAISKEKALNFNKGCVVFKC